MVRVSEKMIREQVEQLRFVTGLDLTVQWADRRPQVYLPMPLKEHGRFELSPRLPTGQLAAWLTAFGTGFGYGQKQAKRPYAVAVARSGVLDNDVVLFSDVGKAQAKLDELRTETDENDDSVDILRVIDGETGEEVTE